MNERYIEMSERCIANDCENLAVGRCARCDEPYCAEHLLREYDHLPGSWRPRCQRCAEDQREAYARVARVGIRGFLVSVGGAVAAGTMSAVVATALLPPGFSRTVVVDLTAVAGLVVGLFWTVHAAQQASGGKP